MDKPIENEKIATRNMFYDEKGRHRRTKKEILDECVKAKIEAAKDSQYYGNVPSLERGRTR